MVVFAAFFTRNQYRRAIFLFSKLEPQDSFLLSSVRNSSLRWYGAVYKQATLSPYLMRMNYFVIENIDDLHCTRSKKGDDYEN